MLFLRLPVDFLTLVLLEKGHRWAVDPRWKWLLLLDGTHGYFVTLRPIWANVFIVGAAFDACVVLRGELCTYNHYLSQQDV